MKKTFEHLLGLNARDALAILKSAGIFGVRVTYTAAPRPPQPAPGATSGGKTEKRSALEAIAGQFEVAEDAESAAYDPLLEPQMTDGMLTEARVVGVRDDGKQLLVSRFKVGDPNPPERNNG
ncbi:MAG: hypothetical protein JW811_04190 [Clostridiales bacterium]|nr:hypothetical protein [Clostridiales bacterium]